MRRSAEAESLGLEAFALILRVEKLERGILAGREKLRQIGPKKKGEDGYQKFRRAELRLERMEGELETGIMSEIGSSSPSKPVSWPIIVAHARYQQTIYKLYPDQRVLPGMAAVYAHMYRVLVESILRVAHV